MKIGKENISQEITLRIIDETRNYFIEETELNKLMSYKHKKVFANLSFVEQFLLSDFAVTGCVSVFAFASLVGISIGITISVIGLNIFRISSAIKKYKSTNTKKKKKHDKQYC